MNNRDIFDEEFEKINGSQTDPFDMVPEPQPPAQQTKRKPMRTLFVCIAVVLAFMLGVSACTFIPVLGGLDDERHQLIDQVFDYMDYQFYEDITDEEWAYAVEMAGSTLMQYAGDQYSFLMGPQTYYDFNNNVGNTLTAASSTTELFGMTYTMEQKGMLVGDVAVDSASFGRLFANDLIVKMTDIVEYNPILDALGNYQFDFDGSLRVHRDLLGNVIPNPNPTYPDGLVLEGATTTEMGKYLSLVYSATFHVLRDGEIKQIPVTRNKVGIAYDKNNVNPNKRYDFQLVEYYFSSEVNNISTTAQNGAAVSTYEQRNLEKLPLKTGYIRIKQFDDLQTTNCATEFRQAMTLFAQNNLEYLVLDLKGNPGGYVNHTVTIAGMLINDKNITPLQQSQVAKDGKLLVTKLVDRDNRAQTEYVASSYDSYFPTNSVPQKRIIVWTDGGSASASELLTGCLTDYGTAVHMGSGTYGKGIAQTIIELDIKGTVTNVNGGKESYPWAIYFTFAKYYSPLGTNIHGYGYTPKAEYQSNDYSSLWTMANNYWYN